MHHLSNSTELSFKEKIILKFNNLLIELFKEEKKYINNITVYNKSQNIILIFKIIGSIIYKILNFFVRLLKNSIFYYILVLLVSLLDEEKLNFLKNIALEGQSSLVKCPSLFDVEKRQLYSNITIFKNFILKSITSIFYEGKLFFGYKYDLHDKQPEETVISSILEFKFTNLFPKFFKFFILILIINILASICSLFINLKMLFPNINQKYTFFLKLIDILPFGMFVNLLILCQIMFFVIIFKFTIKEIKNYRLCLFINLFIVSLMNFCHSDMKFFLEEKNKKYLNIFISNGISNYGLILLMKNIIITHKINFFLSFNSFFFRISYMFLIPERFDGVSIILSFFNLYKGGCCDDIFNPFLQALCIAHITFYFSFLEELILKPIIYMSFANSSEWKNKNSIQEEIHNKNNNNILYVSIAFYMLIMQIFLFLQKNKNKFSYI